MDTNSICQSDTSPLHFKPRGALAKVLYEKTRIDQCLSRIDKQSWYTCNNLSTLPESLSSKFVQLEPDEDSLKFLEQAEQKSDWIFTQIWHVIAKSFLSWFMSQTSINGWLQRGSMFVLSRAQFLQMLKSDESWHKDSLMDLGAGDGGVTAQIAPLFDNVYATEVSHTMQNLLTKRGYTVLDIENWDKDKKYDVISCLNLIDRCNTPLQLLKQIKEALKPDGYVFLALVLPFSAYVELGNKNHKPDELLPVRGQIFEEQVNSLIKEVLEPIGFTVVSWSRVPYLCEGDLKQAYYWLDDSIFVLKSSTS